MIKAKLRDLIERNPSIGKVLASFMGLIEVGMLEVLSFSGKHMSNNFIIRFMRTFLKGRWGGRVVPLNINIPIETKYLPQQEILEIVSRSKVFGIGNCYCRIKHKNCNNPIHTCIGLIPLNGRSLREINYKNVYFKRVSKQKIIDILNDCDDRGLVHQVIYFPTPNYYYVICNCCTCCCEALSNYKKFLTPQLVKSDFFQQTDQTKCISCGTCVDICPFDARQNNSEGNLVVNEEKCFGCGVCIRKCPENAIKLIKRKRS